jgi:hypothetical protein
MSLSGVKLHNLIYFDGYNPEHFEPSQTTELTVRIWSNMGRAQKQGASWGDICTYNRQEMDEVLIERSRRKSTPSPVSISEPVESVIVEAVIIKPVIERVAPSAPALPEIDFEPVKSRPVIKKPHSQPSKRPLCMSCGNYCIHSKPPDSWNAADRKRYCCLGCRDSSGKKHADRCQKHKPQ